MLYIVLAYLMQFAALTNAVCLNNACSFSFFFIDLCKRFLFSCFVFVYFIFFYLHHALCYTAIHYYTSNTTIPPELSYISECKFKN